MKEAKHNPIYCIAISREPSSTLFVKESCFRCYPECTSQRECVRLKIQGQGGDEGRCQEYSDSTELRPSPRQLLNFRAGRDFPNAMKILSWLQVIFIPLAGWRGEKGLTNLFLLRDAIKPYNLMTSRKRREMGNPLTNLSFSKQATTSERRSELCGFESEKPTPSNYLRAL